MAQNDLAFDLNINVTGLPEIQQVQRQVQSVGRSMDRATAAVRRNTGAVADNGRATRRWYRGALQQAGFQVGDYAVQVANGTSAMQAFGQQGSQLLGIFGPVGALLGAGVAIFSAFSLAASRAGGETERLTFNFRQFADDLGVDLDRVGGFFGRVMSVFKNVLITSTNFIINGIRYIGTAIGTLPEAFQAAFEQIKFRMLAFKRNLISLSYSARATIQELRDFLSPTGPEPGFLGDGTAAENLREIAENYRTQAEAARNIAETATGPIQTMTDALRNMTTVDIRDYFSRAAEAVAGDGGGGGGGPSLTDALTEAQERMQSISQSMQSSFENGFMSIVDGTASVKDAFRVMARDIIAQLYRVLVIQRLVGGFDAATGTGTGIVGSIMGAFGGARAMGGPVTAGKAYMVGENGPEMVVPSRNGTVIPNHQLGQQQPVVVNYTFQGGVTEADLGRALPILVQRTKREIVDAVQRGGSMSRAFG